MKPRKVHLTSKIKPSTKHALIAQLALAADEIERLRLRNESLATALRLFSPRQPSLWQRLLAWWRA